MAHFAELDKDNKVLRVCTVDDSNVSADMAVDGETWCANNIPEDPTITYVDGAYPGIAWKQTSFNHNFRKRFAGPGCYFVDDSGTGYFTTPKPYANWVLNTTDGAYYPPVALPTIKDYSEGDQKFEYRITWDQDNTRYIAVKVVGTVNPYWRINTTNLNAQRTNYEDTTYESVTDPSSDLTQIRVWDADANSWS